VQHAIQGVTFALLVVVDGLKSKDAARVQTIKKGSGGFWIGFEFLLHGFVPLMALGQSEFGGAGFELEVERVKLVGGQSFLDRLDALEAQRVLDGTPVTHQVHAERRNGLQACTAQDARVHGGAVGEVRSVIHFVSFGP